MTQPGTMQTEWLAGFVTGYLSNRAIARRSAKIVSEWVELPVEELILKTTEIIREAMTPQGGSSDG